ncbi:MAG: aldehyde dehydrogenase family protein, partial [Janthinobacterium lividum]
MLDSPHPQQASPATDAPTPDAPILDQQALATALSGKHLIGGQFVPARGGKTFAVVNPATRKEVARAAEGDAADVDAAVENADAAQKSWAKMPSRKRGALVAQCAAVIREHVEELARLIAMETGKALRTESRVEANTVADILEFYGGLGGELK